MINLSAGTATGLINVGGGAKKLFYKSSSGSPEVLTTVEWFVVFAVLAAILSIIPNLNSMAWVSFMGAVMAVAYCTLLWTLSISVPRPQGLSYHIVKSTTSVDTTFSILNAVGIVAFAFRGHNLVPDIQVKKILPNREQRCFYELNYNELFFGIHHISNFSVFQIFDF